MGFHFLGSACGSAPSEYALNGIAMRLTDCRQIEVPRFDDPRGCLGVIEGKLNISFDIKRVFYICNVPDGISRAGHALKSCEQLIIAASGAFDIIIDDGIGQSRIRLDSSSNGLYLPPMIWLKLENFLANSVCLVLASEHYSETAYIRSYEQFKMAVA